MHVIRVFTADESQYYDLFKNLDQNSVSTIAYIILNKDVKNGSKLFKKLMKNKDATFKDLYAIAKIFGIHRLLKTETPPTDEEVSQNFCRMTAIDAKLRSQFEKYFDVFNRLDGDDTATICGNFGIKKHTRILLSF